MTGDRRTVTLEEPKMLPIQLGGNRDRGQLVKRYLYAVRPFPLRRQLLSIDRGPRLNSS